MSCVLCRNIIHKANHHLLVEGKAKFDVWLSLSTLPVNVEVDSIYICRPCVDKLKKLQNLNRQIQELLQNLKELYKPGEHGVGSEHCEPRCEHTPTSHQQYLQHVDVDTTKRRRI